MNKIKNPFNENIVSFKTPSNMQVILVSKPEFVNQAVGIGTSLSGLSAKIVVDGEPLELQPGLAHFLEHQLFESEAGSIMDDFTQVGASVNAYTSYHETLYYFSTSNHLQVPLHLLMDMMTNTNLSEASVTKEKGIIIQELAMYDQMPEAKLIRQTFANMYRRHPLKHDIGGTKESVLAIQLEDLHHAFELFYNPKNLIVVIVSHHPLETLKGWVLDHKLSHKTNNDFKLEVIKQWEVLGEVDHFESIAMAINQNKVTVSIPLTEASQTQDPLKLQWALKVLLEGHFSEMNPDYQSWLDQGIINELFDYDVDVEADYGHILFLFENIEPMQAKAFIQVQMQLLKADLKTLEQLKKRWLFTNLRVFNNPSSIMIQLVHYQLKSSSYFDVLHTINHLELKDIEAASGFISKRAHVVEIKSL